MSVRPILAFDFGTKLGWASTDSSGLVLSGRVILKQPQEASSKRAVRFANLVHDLIDMAQPRLIAYEKVYAHSGVQAAHVYGGFEAILFVECERRKLIAHEIGVGVIKKHATGRGDADKALMIMTAKAKWKDQDIIDDNQADALWIMDTAQCTIP